MGVSASIVKAVACLYVLKFCTPAPQVEINYKRNRREEVQKVCFDIKPVEGGSRASKVYHAEPEEGFAFFEIKGAKVRDEGKVRDLIQDIINYKVFSKEYITGYSPIEADKDDGIKFGLAKDGKWYTGGSFYGRGGGGNIGRGGGVSCCRAMCVEV